MLKECNDGYFEVFSDQNSSVRPPIPIKSNLFCRLSAVKRKRTNYHKKLCDNGSRVTNVAMLTAVYRKLNLSCDQAITDPPTIIVFETNVGIYVSIGKLGGRFQIYESETRASVEEVISRYHPTELVIEDMADYPFSLLMDSLKPDRSVSITSTDLSNQFAKRIFEEVGLSQYDLNDLYFKLSDEENVAHTVVGENYENLIENAKITNIYVYKSYHDSEDTNSIEAVSAGSQGFVVLKISCGGFLSVEKAWDGIYIGKSTWFEYLVYGISLYMIGEFEVLDEDNIELIVEDESRCCLRCFFDELKNLDSEEQSRYAPDFIFLDRIFDAVASNQFNFKISSVNNVAEKVLGSRYAELLNSAKVTHVAVYKTPLDSTFTKSYLNRIKRYLKIQWTSVDFHAFLVLKTNIGIFLSLDKQQDGIYISKSPLYKYLVYGLPSSTRNTPVELIVEARSKYSLSYLIENLGCEKNEYDTTEDNCQHFAKRHFDKMALRKHWEFERPREYFYKLSLQTIIIVIGVVIICNFLSISSYATLIMIIIFTCRVLYSRFCD